MYKQLVHQEPITPMMIAAAVNNTPNKAVTLLPEPYEFPAEGENGERFPYDLMRILSIHQQRANRTSALPLPPGVDPVTIMKEREHRLHLN